MDLCPVIGYLLVELSQCVNDVNQLTNPVTETVHV